MQTGSMHKYTLNPKHKENLRKKNEGQQTLHQRCVITADATTRGMTMSAEEKGYKCGTFIAAANGNVPISAIKYFAEWANPYAQMTVRSEQELIINYISMATKTITGDI